MVSSLSIFIMIICYGRFLLALLALTVLSKHAFTAKARLSIEKKGGTVAFLPWTWLMIAIGSTIVWWYQ